MITILATLILFGIAVLFHEFGHFIIAKLLKIRVERFSFGFPPRLFGIKFGDTDYCVGAIPLGGYVKVTGQDPTEELTGAEYEFSSRPPWQRMLVVAAGPVMNFVIAYILIVIALVYGVPAFSPELDMVLPDTPAAQSGLIPGDTLVSINNDQINSMEGFMEKLEIQQGKSVRVGINRDNKPLMLNLNIPSKIKEMSDIGFEFKIPSVVGIVQPDKPATRAGIQLNDEIISVNGIPTEGRWQNVTKVIRSGKGEELTMTVKRGKEIKIFNIKPEYSKMENSYLIGIATKPYTKGYVRYSIMESISRGIRIEYMQIYMFFWGFHEIFKGKIPMKEALGGPQSIANIAGQYIQLGLGYYLIFISAMSVTLGIINLIPIPLVDGGHIFFYLIETIKRKPLSPKILEMCYRAGFAFLITLMTYVLINDFVSSGTLSKLLSRFR